jgi:inhibitor of KinA sporulation pathway (predicted exonuclease)
MPQFLCILDFEATCDDSIEPFSPQEIIEFPSVLIHVGDGFNPKIVSEFQEYIKPVRNPKLTEFCKSLTGISQCKVDGGSDFESALKRHAEWLAEKIGARPTSENVIVVTCGDWDIKTMLPKQCELTGVDVPEYLRQPCNLKIVAQDFWGLRHPPKGMVHMLDRLKLPLQGRHHSGIDDCRNIARICMRLGSSGCLFRPTSELIYDKFNHKYTYMRVSPK